MERSEINSTEANARKSSKDEEEFIQKFERILGTNSTVDINRFCNSFPEYETTWLKMVFMANQNSYRELYFQSCKRAVEQLEIQDLNEKLEILVKAIFGSACYCTHTCIWIKLGTIFGHCHELVKLFDKSISRAENIDPYKFCSFFKEYEKAEELLRSTKRRHASRSASSKPETKAESTEKSQICKKTSKNSKDCFSISFKHFIALVKKLEVNPKLIEILQKEEDQDKEITFVLDSGQSLGEMFDLDSCWSDLYEKLVKPRKEKDSKLNKEDLSKIEEKDLYHIHHSFETDLGCKEKTYLLFNLCYRLSLFNPKTIKDTFSKLVDPNETRVLF